MSTKSSINKIELEKFSKISDQWLKENGEFKILHKINPIRLSYITGKIYKHFYNDIITPKFDLDILDVGCGGGLISSELSKTGAKVTGIDAIEDNIKIAIEHAKAQSLQLDYIYSTVEQLIDSSYKQYDIILCLELLEHIDNIDDFVQNLTSLLKPNGMIIISTINRTVKSYMLAILAAEYLLGWVPKKTHDFNKFLKPSELYTLFGKHNMDIKELKGLTYNIITNNWYLTDDIEVNYFAYITKDKTVIG